LEQICSLVLTNLTLTHASAKQNTQCRGLEIGYSYRHYRQTAWCAVTNYRNRVLFVCEVFLWQWRVLYQILCTKLYRKSSSVSYGETYSCYLTPLITVMKGIIRDN